MDYWAPAEAVLPCPRWSKSIPGKVVLCVLKNLND